jgi:hypothetical protein
VFSLTFSDGGGLTLSDEEAHALYEELWGDAETRGAVSAAARVRHSIALDVRASKPVAFGGHEAEAVHAALRRLQKM